MAWILLIPQYEMQTSTTVATFSQLVIAACMLFVSAGNVRAEGWKAPRQRAQPWIKLADKLGMQRASQRAVNALNRAYGLKLTPDKVRLVSYSGGRKFWSFVDSAKKTALGMAVTPHGTGPHPHLVAGDRVYDGIQPNWKVNGRKSTFFDGTMMRKGSLGQEHHNSTRLLCLFNAPTSAVQAVGAAADKTYHLKRNEGYNCAAYVTDHLKPGKGKDPHNPFSWINSTWSPRSAVQQVMKAQPDMLIQVVPEQDFHRIAKDPNHLVKFWHQQQLGQ